MNRRSFVFLFLFLPFGGWSQSVSDSLLAVIRSSAPDTSRVNALNLFSDQLWLAGRYKDEIVYADSALLLSQRIKFKAGEARSYYNKCKGLHETGNYAEGLKNAHLSMNAYIELKDKKGISNAYNYIGRIYADQANYPEAIKNYLEAMKLRSAIGDKKGVASTYNNIGNIYISQGNYREALKNHLSALSIREEINDKQGMGSTYHNIATIYGNEKKYSEALTYFKKALEINTKLGKKNWIANNQLGMADVYENMHDYKKALSQDLIGLQIKKEVGDKLGIASCWISISRVLILLKELDQPRAYLDSALRLSKEVGSRDIVKECYRTLAQLDYARGKYKDAYDHYHQFSLYKDSLINTENSKNIAMLNARFDLERKDTEIKLLNKEKETRAELSQEESSRKKLIIWSVIGILVLAAAFSVFIYKRLQFVNSQKKIIGKQQKHILDSIRYARLIQKSIIPGEKELASLLPFETFALFLPKDIVSGDFYWVSPPGSLPGNKFVIAAGDCTGHGVPGAFLSMIGTMLLNEAVREKKLSDPSDILRELHRGMFLVLHKENENMNSKAGMDIALCLIDKDTNTLHYAGAGNAIYLVEPNENRETGSPAFRLEKIRPDRFTIGETRSADGSMEEREFTVHRFPLKNEMRIYLFTDGYRDQLSSETKQRIGGAQFRKMILEGTHLPVSEQRKDLADRFSRWKGTADQVDDVLVMGIKIG